MSLVEDEMVDDADDVEEADVQDKVFPQQFVEASAPSAPKKSSKKEAVMLTRTGHARTRTMTRTRINITAKKT